MKLQRKKLLKFANWLERQRKADFDLSIVENCIVGFLYRWLRSKGVCDYFSFNSSELIFAFGIPTDVAWELYTGSGSVDTMDIITRMDAVRALRNVAHGRKLIWE